METQMEAILWAVVIFCTALRILSKLHYAGSTVDTCAEFLWKKAFTDKYDPCDDHVLHHLENPKGSLTQARTGL